MPEIDDGMWTEKLYDEFPGLFIERRIECGPGWEGLIRTAVARVLEWNKLHPDGYLTFSLIKEKFGGMRIHVENRAGPDSEYPKFSDLESRSVKVCENCGSTDMADKRSYGGWMSTLCVKCHDRRMILWAMRNVP